MSDFLTLSTLLYVLALFGMFAVTYCVLALTVFADRRSDRRSAVKPSNDDDVGSQHGNHP